MEVQIIQGDITQLKVDAIVNAANTSLLGGGGVDGAIHRKAGPRLLEECRTLGGCQVGEAKITKGYNLPASNIIHTVGPVWRGGINKEKILLQNCYKNSLDIAIKQNLRSLAFPCISTGVYHFPKQQAAEIAIAVVREYIKAKAGIEKVVFVCFSQEDYQIYQKILKLKEI